MHVRSDAMVRSSANANAQMHMCSCAGHTLGSFPRGSLLWRTAAALLHGRRRAAAMSLALAPAFACQWHICTITVIVSVVHKCLHALLDFFFPRGAHLTSPHLASPHLTSPHLAASLTSPHLTSPHLISHHLTLHPPHIISLPHSTSFAHIALRFTSTPRRASSHCGHSTLTAH
jgi:hypothetical protein